MNNLRIQEQQEESELISDILNRFEKARNRRSRWEKLWQESYDYCLPQNAFFTRPMQTGEHRTDHIFDGTAPDAADQLAAGLLANLTPPWSQWFGLKPGPELDSEQAESLSGVLENAARTVQDHFDRSNFVVEIHQSFLDLVVGGTACLSFEESDPGSYSAFKFSSVPLWDVTLEEGDSGNLEDSFRAVELEYSRIIKRYEASNIPEKIHKQGQKNPKQKFRILEAILSHNLTYSYIAMIFDGEGDNHLLENRNLISSPLISFRWIKTPGETYGRSPVMKALPDIKTANKVVELVLKNASISVTGIWQADDDGVLNTENIELVPGSIIPKAVGSKGLTPLEMPGRFDISQIVLEDLRTRIRHALLNDRLGPIGGANMTATEVIERTSEMAMLLGATYGRLQSELLTPLIRRAYLILRRRGEVPDLEIDGRNVVVDFRSPLARAQGQRNVRNTLEWINTVMSMGQEASGAVNFPEVARFLGNAMGVPSDLIKNEVMPVTIPAFNGVFEGNEQINQAILNGMAELQTEAEAIS